MITGSFNSKFSKCIELKIIFQIFFSQSDDKNDAEEVENEDTAWPFLYGTNEVQSSNQVQKSKVTTSMLATNVEDEIGSSPDQTKM